MQISDSDRLKSVLDDVLSFDGAYEKAFLDLVDMDKFVLTYGSCFP